MKNIYNTLFLIFVLCVTALKAEAQYPVWNDPNSLPIWMTPEEESRKHEIGQYFMKSAAIAGEMRNVAEFERMEGVLVRYPLGLPVSLIASFSQHTVVYTLVSNTSNENSARSAYQSAGANMTNIKFITASTDSYWTRDYGPWYVVNENNEMGIVDFPYNRPRPLDDAVPGILSTYFSVPMYSMPVVHTGGNYMTDGWGISASSDLVYEENSNNATWVNQQMNDYLGISTYHVTIDPLGGIKHIDCWAKFLDVDKILITRVPTSNSNYAKYEQMATYYAGQMSSYGTPFQVFRVYSPSGQPYTNSLILNDRVYVPIMSSTPSSTDNAALDVYREAMPGYTVVGIYYNGWLTSDALHCRAMGLADRKMLYIKHLPLSGSYNYQSGFDITADIVPLGGQALKTDSLFVIYKTNARDYDTINLVRQTGDTFKGTIPVNSGETEIHYYIYAVDQSGRRESHPFTGRADPNIFQVENPVVVADFSASTTTVALGQPVVFTDLSTGGPFISWAWNFGEGASPGSATGEGPHQVVYTTPGTKSVSLTLDGVYLKVRANYITVTGTVLAVSPAALPGVVCPGGSVALSSNASGGAGSYTYSWTSVPAGFTSALASPVVAPLVTTTYTVVAGDGYSTATGSVVVTVNPLPAAPTAGSNSPVCAGGTINLTASTISGATYSWTGPNGFSTSLQNPSITNATTAMGGTYNVTATIAGCTGPAGTANVVVNTLPIVYNVGGGGSYCSGGTGVSITLSGSQSGVTYELWRDGSATGTTKPGTGSALTFSSVTAAGTYTIKGTSTNSCISTMSGNTTVTVNANPSAPVSGGDKSYCSDQPVPALTVTVGSGATADWFAAASGGTALATGTLSYTPSSAGTYYAEARNTTTGCVSTTRIAVTLTMNTAATVSVTIAASANNVCAGTQVTYTATPVNGGTTPAFQWKVNGTNAGTNSATYSYTPVNNDQVTCVLTSNAACISGNPATSNAVVMKVNALPVVYAGADRSIPYGTSVTMSDATAMGSAPLGYAWTPASAFVNAGALQAVTVNLTATAPYLLTVTDGNGCISSDQVTILVEAQNSPPVLGAIGNQVVRQFMPLTFTATATDPDPATVFTFSLVGAPAGATLNPSSGLFSWIPSETQGPGSYPFTLRVCDNGTPGLCDEEAITVTVSESPSISGQVFHDTDRMSDGQVDGSGTNAGGGLYANLLGAGNTVVASVEVASGGTFIFADVTAGSYVVQITKNQGVAGAGKPATALPANWIYTGEHLGAGPGDDGTPDGLLSVVTDGNNDVTEARFGIVKLPDITTSLTVSPNVMDGITSFNVLVKITELNQVGTDGLVTVLIPRDIRWSFQGEYNPALTMLGSVALNNGDWSYNSGNPDYHIFSTSVAIPAGKFSTFGFVAVFNPGNTRGIYTITSQITSGSGGESSVKNNADSEKLDYFSE